MPANPPQRYVLAVAHQAGRDPGIRKGADGGRDFFSPAELERAAWRFMQGPREVGIGHADGTVGVADCVESYCWPEGAPDWPQPDGTVIKSGDWLIGFVCRTEQTFEDCRKGLFGGVSVQGAARRITPGAP